MSRRKHTVFCPPWWVVPFALLGASMWVLGACWLLGA